ncbi:MAG: outer membrane protein assembly factor BamB family protein [Methanosarcinaceae archaeon]
MEIKKDLKLVVVMAIVVAMVVLIHPASASDWEQFQKDEINSGWTTDCAPIYVPTLEWWKPTSGTGMGGIDVNSIVADGAVYVIDYQGLLWSFDATTGTENWHTDLTEGAGQFEISTPAYNNGIVYAAVSSGRDGEGAGRVCAVNADDGTIRECKYYGLDTFQLNTPITYADNRIYIGNWKGGYDHTEDNGTYYCIDAGNVENEIWSRTAPYVTGYYWAGAVIVGDYIIYGGDRANVTCLDKDTGALVDYINVSEQCGITPVEEIRSSIVWNEDTGRIYFTGKKLPDHGHVYAVSFDSNNGDLGGDGAIGGGSCDWVTSIGYSTSTPTVYDGRVYVGQGGFGPTGKVYCLDEADGSQEWVTGNLGGVQSSPALSVVNGRKFIYFTVNDDDGSAYCIEDLGNDQYNIEWEWNPPNPDTNYILQGMAISDGFVYFGTDDGILYALKEGGGLCGDVNRDDFVDATDIVLVDQKVWQPPKTLCNEWAGDVNCDGFVDSTDIVLLDQKVWNPPKILSCC